VDKVKHEVRMLKRKHEALKEREARLVRDIDQGELGDAAQYRLPLSLVSANTAAAAQPSVPRFSAEDVARMRAVASLKAKLQAAAICHGVTCVRDEASDESKYMFDPYIGGKPYGPYVVRITYSNEGPVFKGHSLPHAVPVRALRAKHLGDQGLGRDQAEQVEALLEDIYRHLRGFLSRQQQFLEFKDRFASDLKEYSTASHFTAISFSLKIDDDDHDSSESMTIKISMLYDKDAERPQQGSLKVSFDPPMGEEEEEEITNQCEVFYRFTLSEAIAKIFTE